VIGKLAPPALGGVYVQGAKENVMKEQDAIIDFINEKGCVPDGKGNNVLMTRAIFKALVDSTAAKTEVVGVNRAAMRRQTGRDDAIAFGITWELKKAIEDAQNDQYGSPASQHKNVMALNTFYGDMPKTTPGPPDKNGLTDPAYKDPKSQVIAHEFLHIILRQIDNPALGGGARKSDNARDIGEIHHTLTDYLQWHVASVSQQSANPWNRPSTPPSSCPAATQPAAPAAQ
jgi:hypothetical protein